MARCEASCERCDPLRPGCERPAARLVACDQGRTDVQTFEARGLRADDRCHAARRRAFRGGGPLYDDRSVGRQLHGALRRPDWGGSYRRQREGRHLWHLHRGTRVRPGALPNPDPDVRRREYAHPPRIVRVVLESRELRGKPELIREPWHRGVLVQGRRGNRCLRGRERKRHGHDHVRRRRGPGDADGNDHAEVLIARTTSLRSRALLRFALAAIGAGIALVACAGSGRNADKAATGRETTTAGAPNETETGGKIESGTDAAEAIAPAGVIAYQTDRTGRE